MARSGTDKRQRALTLTARFNDQEARVIREQAERAGLSVGSLIRFALLNVPPPRATRSPTVNHVEVARLIGELGRLSDSLTRLASHHNAAPRVIEEIARNLSEMRVVCFLALGRQP